MSEGRVVLRGVGDASALLPSVTAAADVIDVTGVELVRADGAEAPGLFRLQDVLKRTAPRRVELGGGNGLAHVGALQRVLYVIAAAAPSVEHVLVGPDGNDVVQAPMRDVASAAVSRRVTCSFQQRSFVAQHVSGDVVWDQPPPEPTGGPVASAARQLREAASSHVANVAAAEARCAAVWTADA